MGFQLQPPAVTIAVGDTVQVHATPINEDGEVYDTVGPWTGIYWYATVWEVIDTLDFLAAQSSNPIKVIGVSPGQTDICPSAEGISRECAAVTVEARPMSLK